MSADEVDDARPDPDANEIGLADIQIDAERVRVGSDVEFLGRVGPREPPLELEVPDRLAGELDDARGGRFLAARGRTVLRFRFLRGGRRVVGIPPLVDMWLGTPPRDQGVVGSLVEQTADDQIAVGRDDPHTPQRVRGADYGRAMTTDTGVRP